MSAHAAAGARTAVAAPRARWGMLEWYLIAILLGSGLVFLPGSGSIRPLIRGLPFALSAAIFVWHFSSSSRRSVPAIAKVIAPALVLYVVNVFHPLTAPMLGLATVAYHLAIIGPVFWAGDGLRNVAHFQKLLWLILGASMLNVVVGILQAAFPYIFMPPSLNGVVEVIAQQTYLGPFGQVIVRPPGLSDLPGGASSAGAVAAVLGLGYAVRTGASNVHRIVGLGCLMSGMFILYLTQVRAFAIMTIFGLLIFAAVAFVQGRGRHMFIWGVGALVLVALIGLSGPTYDPANPYAPAGRFQQILDQGLFKAFMANRGFFLVQTFNELMFRFPLGAGLGRWGMTREYFGQGSPFSQIWVEIQPTGWLLDGGILMWIFYGGALIASMGYAFRLAMRPGGGELAFVAAMTLGLQVVIVGSGLAGPVFNTVFGSLFWFLTGGLFAVAESVKRAELPGRSRTTWLKPAHSMN